MSKSTDEIREVLLGYDETEVLDALVSMAIIDAHTGTLTDYWRDLLSPPTPSLSEKDLKTVRDFAIVLNRLRK